MSKKYAKDDLGVRMKDYEATSKTRLLKGMPVIVRVDGKAFHTYTKDCERPFDEELAQAFWYATKETCKEFAGVKIAYHQSDEVSFLLMNYNKVTTQPPYNNEVQKLTSLFASKFTLHFNYFMWQRGHWNRKAEFDARVWNLPEHEVCNYFIWRSVFDAQRNSVSMLAQANFSHKSLQNLSTKKLQEKLILEKGIDWNSLPVWQKRGVAIIKKQEPKTVTYNGETKAVIRNVWDVDHEMPIFTQDRNYIEQYVYPEKETVNYSDDEVLKRAIEAIKNGKTEEEVQKEFNLSSDDMHLIDFVVNEF